MLDRYPDPRQQPRRGPRRRRRRPEEEVAPPAPQSPAGRYLAITAVILVLLILLARSRSAPAPAPASEAQQEAADAVDTPPRPARPPAPRPPPPPAAAPSATPTLDLLARLEAHRRVTRAGSAVYLDSLLAESDSTLRRWTGGPGSPVTVAFVDDDIAAQVSFGTDVVRNALRAWEALPLGLNFNVIQDTASADVVVRWIPRFEPVEQRAGQTDIEVDQNGTIRRGAIRLAVTGTDGRKLDRAAAMTVAMHEVGHMLGLAHSPDARDVMYATPRTSALSDRDRRTIELIYGLPAGSVKGGDR
jgi:hypothetical protein